MLKVPRWWLWMLGGFVIVATLSLRYFAEREEKDHGRYGVGTCLRDEEVKVLYRVQERSGDSYVLRVLLSEKFPLDDLYRVGGERSLPAALVEGGSGLRPVICPQSGER
ncbi:MAG: hypothetical protein KF802_12990 [Bdellovibrionaceae bacterium]|nr:hypothetical protein [Pseudobdellovibrionaceae bacterium]